MQRHKKMRCALFALSTRFFYGDRSAGQAVDHGIMAWSCCPSMKFDSWHVKTDHDLDNPRILILSWRCKMLRRICIAQIHAREHALPIDRVGYADGTRQHEVDHTDQDDCICPERCMNRSWTVGGTDHTDRTDHLSVVWTLCEVDSGTLNNRNVLSPV